MVLQLHLVVDDTPIGEMKIDAVSDGSWAGTTDCKSTTGVTVWVGKFLMMSASRTQTVVALSSCEAELMAATVTATEAKLVQNLISEMGYDLPIELHTDNSACESLVYREGPGKVRHLTVRQLWLQSQMREGLLRVRHVPGAENVSDLLTKALPRQRFEELRARAGLEQRAGGVHAIWQAEDEEQRDFRIMQILITLVVIGAVQVVLWLIAIVTWCRRSAWSSCRKSCRRWWWKCWQSRRATPEAKRARKKGHHAQDSRGTGSVRHHH